MPVFCVKGTTKFFEVRINNKNVRGPKILHAEGGFSRIQLENDSSRKTDKTDIALHFDQGQIRRAGLKVHYERQHKVRDNVSNASASRAFASIIFT